MVTITYRFKQNRQIELNNDRSVVCLFASVGHVVELEAGNSLMCHYLFTKQSQVYTLYMAEYYVYKCEMVIRQQRTFICSVMHYVVYQIYVQYIWKEQAMEGCFFNTVIPNKIIVEDCRRPDMADDNCRHNNFIFSPLLSDCLK